MRGRDADAALSALAPRRRSATSRAAEAKPRPKATPRSQAKAKAKPKAGGGRSGARKATGRRPSRRGAVARRRTLRRRVALLVVALAVGGGVAYALSSPVDRAVQEISLPLRHDDIIRQQAADKDLDPALIAGVIYTESRFRDQTSPAGAKGLMQLLPTTADYIAQKSGGTAFEQGDLADPQINIAYGSFYLRYLMDKYDDNEILSLAAYNGGEGAVDRWVASARAAGEAFRVSSHIPYTETRQYVGRVLRARRTYRREYPAELGLRDQ